MKGRCRMSGNGKGRPHSAGGGMGSGGGSLSKLALPSEGAVIAPDISILPQKPVNCQERTIGETRQLLALADDCLRRHNEARAAAIASGDPRDYQAAAALADDRRALLAQIGGR